MKVVATAKNLNINLTNEQGEIVASYSVKNYVALFDLAALLQGIKPLVATITEIAEEVSNAKE